MIASRNIGQGDVIFREKATVVGPKQGTQPLCLNCYGGVSETSVRCVDCNFPFCTQHCAEVKINKTMPITCSFIHQK